MFNSKVLSFGLLLASSVSATTAPGFPIQAASTLNVTFSTNNVSPAGELIPRPDTVNPPNITTPVWTSAGKGVLLMVDSDVPRNGTRVELLHWLISNVTLTGNSTLSFSGPGEAPYLQPSPPVGDVSHAYTLVLFAQPEDFAVPAEFTDVLQSRVFFNISNFVTAAKLGQALAGNYIQVQNLTGTPTTTFPPPRPTNETTPSNTSVPLFPGAASQMVLGGGKVFWAGFGTAVVAGIAAFAL